MTNKLFVRLISSLEDKLKSPLASYPKYPNKLQVSALIIFFKSYPFLLSSPIKWSSKEKALAPLESKIRCGLFVLWVFLFDFLVGVVFPGVLLILEFGEMDGEETKFKMGLKIASFQMLFLVGTSPYPFISIFLWAMSAKDIAHDYKEAGQFANYLDNLFKQTSRRHRKIDIMGILSHFNGQGLISTSYFIPLMALYFKMDPMWHLLHRIIPSCITDDGYVANDNLCKALFYGIRPFTIYAWIANSGRAIGGTIMFAWIFFEMYNQCVAMLNDLKPKLGIRLYWVCWKVSAGMRYWSRGSFAAAIYGGIWLVTVSLYATIVVIPNAHPLSFIYITFPVCGGVSTVAFCCLPYALKFPLTTRNLIDKWRFTAGISGNCLEGKIMRREVRAMQPVTLKVGNFFDLDKTIVVFVITSILDETINLVVSMNTL